MKKKCLSYMSFFLFSAFVIFFILLMYFPLAPVTVTPRVPPSPFKEFIAAGAALIASVPLTLAYITLHGGFFVLIRERSQLAAAGQGDLPEDGTFGAVFGRLQGKGTPLSAPFSRRPCLSYHYQITHRTGGSHSSTTVDTEGFALSPSCIETRKGPVDLLAYIELDFTPEVLEADKLSENVLGYLQTAELFQTGPFEFKKNWDHWKTVARDDDGTIRMDRGSAKFDPSSQSITEKIVQAGDSVCVFGRYSAARHAIVPDPQQAEFETARLMKGPLEKMLRTLTIKAVCQVVFIAAFLGAFGLFLRAFFLYGTDFWS